VGYRLVMIGRSMVVTESRQGKVVMCRGEHVNSQLGVWLVIRIETLHETTHLSWQKVYVIIPLSLSSYQIQARWSLKFLDGVMISIVSKHM
jgi:hypothetical protein